MSAPERYWSVTVTLNGEELVTIEPNWLSGRDIGPAEEEAIRSAAYHLLGFIGDPAGYHGPDVQDSL